jgi:large subunit ribosomal protein L17
MRHRSNRLRLNQKPNHAKLMLRNMVTSVILYESIRTTRKRARIVQPLIDNLITTAKTKSPHIAIRSINLMVTDINASKKLMEVFAKRYAGRSSGFSRMVPVGSRKGDGAELVDLTLVDAEIASNNSSKKSDAAAAPAKKVTKKKTATASAK